jgi:hypothetical protein
VRDNDEANQDEEAAEDEYATLVRQLPIGIIFARIIVVSGMSFAAALAIFMVIGGLWLPALACLGITLLFLFLMFFIERGAESSASHDS